MVRTPQAEQDLLDIWDYVATYDDAAADRLADHPFMGVGQPQLGSALRRFSVVGYRLYYRPVHNGILLIRVLHGARDERAILADD